MFERHESFRDSILRDSLTFAGKSEVSKREKSVEASGDLPIQVCGAACSGVEERVVGDPVEAVRCPGFPTPEPLLCMGLLVVGVPLTCSTVLFHFSPISPARC